MQPGSGRCIVESAKWWQMADAEMIRSFRGGHLKRCVRRKYSLKGQMTHRPSGPLPRFAAASLAMLRLDSFEFSDSEDLDIIQKPRAPVTSSPSPPKARLSKTDRHWALHGDAGTSSSSDDTQPRPRPTGAPSRPPQRRATKVADATSSSNDDASPKFRPHAAPVVWTASAVYVSSDDFSTSADEDLCPKIRLKPTTCAASKALVALDLSKVHGFQDCGDRRRSRRPDGVSKSKSVPKPRPRPRRRPKWDLPVMTTLVCHVCRFR